MGAAFPCPEEVGHEPCLEEAYQEEVYQEEAYLEEAYQGEVYQEEAYLEEVLFLYLVVVQWQRHEQEVGHP